MNVLIPHHHKKTDKNAYPTSPSSEKPENPLFIKNAVPAGDILPYSTAQTMQ